MRPALAEDLKIYGIICRRIAITALHQSFGGDCHTPLPRRPQRTLPDALLSAYRPDERRTRHVENRPHVRWIASAWPARVNGHYAPPECSERRSDALGALNLDPVAIALEIRGVERVDLPHAVNEHGRYDVGVVDLPPRDGHVPTQCDERLSDSAPLVTRSRTKTGAVLSPSPTSPVE